MGSVGVWEADSVESAWNAAWPLWNNAAGKTVVIEVACATRNAAIHALVRLYIMQPPPGWHQVYSSEQASGDRWLAQTQWQCPVAN